MAVRSSPPLGCRWGKQIGRRSSKADRNQATEVLEIEWQVGTDQHIGEVRRRGRGAAAHCLEGGCEVDLRDLAEHRLAPSRHVDLGAITDAEALGLLERCARTISGSCAGIKTISGSPI